MSRRGSFPDPSPTAHMAPAHHLLSSSVSSFSSTIASRHPSSISKTYRQASTLFLTRRLPEALSTIQPLVGVPEAGEASEPAPAATASKTTRVKIWSLYLTILNAVVELEPQEGKDAFGNTEWRAICSRVRDGEVWEEVVKNGYHGVEGDVDPEVVINLATLLLAHARDQILNQRRLESFLALSTQPSLDFDGKFAQPHSPAPRLNRRHHSPTKGASGANTPRDLNARVKILELYTLHVLVRNSEWDYAREFISMSSVLDDERREAFLQALQSLHEDQQEHDRLQEEERERQEEQLRKENEAARRLRAENEEREKKRLDAERARREGSEVDYGVDDTQSASGSRPRSTSHSSSVRPVRSPNQSGRGAKGKAVASHPSAARTTTILGRLRAMIGHITYAIENNPLLMMRFLAFIMGLILMFGSRAVRDRVRRLLGTSWNKLRATAGMASTVSYI